MDPTILLTILGSGRERQKRVAVHAYHALGAEFMTMSV